MIKKVAHQNEKRERGLCVCIYVNEREIEMIRLTLSRPLDVPVRPRARSGLGTFV